MTGITSIQAITGGAAVHVSIADLLGVALPPADIVCTGGDGIVTAVADATGFNITAAAGSRGSQELTFTYKGTLETGPTVDVLTVEIIPAQALQFTSP